MLCSQSGAVARPFGRVDLCPVWSTSSGFGPVAAVAAIAAPAVPIAPFDRERVDRLDDVAGTAGLRRCRGGIGFHTYRSGRYLRGGGDRPSPRVKTGVDAARIRRQVRGRHTDPGTHRPGTAQTPIPRNNHDNGHPARTGCGSGVGSAIAVPTPHRYQVHFSDRYPTPGLTHREVSSATPSPPLLMGAESFWCRNAVDAGGATEPAATGLQGATHTAPRRCHDQGRPRPRRTGSTCRTMPSPRNKS